MFNAIQVSLDEFVSNLGQFNSTVVECLYYLTTVQLHNLLSLTYLVPITVLVVRNRQLSYV